MSSFDQRDAERERLRALRYEQFLERARLYYAQYSARRVAKFPRPGVAFSRRRKRRYR